MILKNIRILDFSSPSAPGEKSLCIREGLIKGFVSEPFPGGEDVLDGKGMYCIPGMVNTHAHTAMTLLRGTAEDARPSDWFNKYIWMYEKNLTPQDVYLGTLLGAAEMLLSGTTCVADHYFSMDQAYRAFNESGMRADLAWAYFGFGDNWREKYEQALAFTLEHSGRNSKISLSLGPHSPYLCPDSLLMETARAASDNSLRVHIHVSEEANQLTRSLWDRRLTPIEVLDRTGILAGKTLLAHAYHATARDFTLLSGTDTLIAHCPLTYLRFGDIKGFLAKAIKHGIRTGLGSDGAASNGTMGLLAAARGAALLAKGSAGDAEAGQIQELLPLLTAAGKVLVSPDYGSFKEGSPADLVLINHKSPCFQPENNPFSSLIYCADSGSIDTVLVAGEPVVREGRLLTIDTEGLYREASQRIRRLLQTSGGNPMQNYGS